MSMWPVLDLKEQGKERLSVKTELSVKKKEEERGKRNGHKPSSGMQY
jgi:hypothetical protein